MDVQIAEVRAPERVVVAAGLALVREDDDRRARVDGAGVRAAVAPAIAAGVALLGAAAARDEEAGEKPERSRFERAHLSSLLALEDRVDGLHVLVRAVAGGQHLVLGRRRRVEVEREPALDQRLALRHRARRVLGNLLGDGQRFGAQLLARRRCA